MRPVTNCILLPTAIEPAWEEVSRLDRHAEWMADVDSIRFLSQARAGVGTRLAVGTRFGPFRTEDILEVVEWEPPRCIAVEHRGLFTGRGRFLLEPAGLGATRFTWEEQVRFPWFLGGPLGALAARPVFYLVWRRNLRRLRRRLSAP